MKISFKILLLITCTILQLNGQQTEERWDGYMAAYEEEQNRLNYVTNGFNRYRSY